MESDEQKAFIKWFRGRWPQYASAINVSLRGLNFGSGPRAARMINHIKSQGSVAGEADLRILVPRKGYGCLVIEHKGAGQPYSLTEKQKDYLGFHNMVGNLAVSTRGLDELKQVVEDYLGGKNEARGADFSNQNGHQGKPRD